MDSSRLDREALLEIGAGLFALSLVAGVVMLFGGRIFGGMARQNGEQRSAPNAGDIPASRQQHIAASSPR
ncbi:MAG: hypothetical protein WBA63_04165 [Thermomicrobiales bacterium]